MNHLDISAREFLINNKKIPAWYITNNYREEKIKYFYKCNCLNKYYDS